jgi:hypothetical protein
MNERQQRIIILKAMIKEFEENERELHKVWNRIAGLLK